jgi:hypothetical protein
MHDYALAHLSDAALLRDLASLVAQDRLTTANVLAYIAEVDSRKLYAPAGYTSMHAYCVDELRLSDDAAYKRIQAARAARKFPVLIEAVAEGRLHLTAVSLIAPHLTPENAQELIEAATHRRKCDIEAWLAPRFPLPEPRTVVRAISGPRLVPAQAVTESVATNGDLLAPAQVADDAFELAPAQVANARFELAPAQVGVDPRGGDAFVQAGDAKADPPPARYLIQVTVDKSTHDKLRQLQALLSHAVPNGNVAHVLDRAFDALLREVERQKLGSANRMRDACPLAPPSAKRPTRSRYVPATIRRAVWERDRGQCTFVSAKGTLCEAKRFLQFDHTHPVARGGRATVEGMRLRCRAHNQLEAERAFGADFMRRKREEARVAVTGREERESTHGAVTQDGIE